MLNRKSVATFLSSLLCILQQLLWTIVKRKSKSSPKSFVQRLTSNVLGLGLCLLYYHYSTHHPPQTFQTLPEVPPPSVIPFRNLSWPPTRIQTQMQKFCKFFANLNYEKFQRSYQPSVIPFWKPLQLSCKYFAKFFAIYTESRDYFFQGEVHFFQKR